MNYRSVLVLHTIQDSLESLKAALMLANKWNAHIDICVVSIPVAMQRTATLQGVDLDGGAGAKADIAHTNERLVEIRKFTDKHQIAVNLVNHFTIEQNIEELIAKSTLFVDLVIMSHGSSLLSGISKKCLDAALFNSNMPVLLTSSYTVPAKKKDDQSNNLNNVVIAWHEDTHAMQAIRAAFPLLAAAKKIDVVLVVNGSIKHISQNNDADSLTSAIETYLKRHSLNVNLNVVPTDGRFISHALLDTISNLVPDLVVMGAFGHSPIAEKMFHGVTHDVLESLDYTNLFLSHA